MGEEWATSSPFLYFADHDDEEMRKSVAEGRQREFASFGFDGDVPNPEDQKTFDQSKLNWQEQGVGKHAHMLSWVKSLIKLRGRNVCLNDGDMHHLLVSTDDDRQTLVMQREEARILVNLGKSIATFALLEGERMELISRDGIEVQDDCLHLPPMTLAVLLSTSDAMEERQRAPHKQ